MNVFLIVPNTSGLDALDENDHSLGAPVELTGSSRQTVNFLTLGDMTPRARR